MSLKYEAALNGLKRVEELVKGTLATIDNIDRIGEEVVQSHITISYEQLRTDLVEANMKLAKIKKICEDPNTDDYFALGQIMDIVGTTP